MSGKTALVISLAVAGFVMMAENSKCLEAQAICQAGSDPTFTQPIKITGTGTNTATLSAANVTANRTLTLPDVDGALLAGTLTNDAPFISVSSTGALDSSQTLTASTPLKSTALGQITASDLVPETDLTIGSGLANQVLSVNGTATALVFRNETTPSYTANAPYIKVDAAGAADSSSTLTANSPCLKADASGQIEACPSLTNSTPLKASATGQIEASDLDITTDITAGAALQQIRTNAAGTALEYFTPTSSAPNIRKVADGTTTAGLSTGEESMCWYGQHTLDKTKRYRLVFDGGVYNIGAVGYYSYWKAIKDDCVTGTGANWDTTGAYDTNGYIAGGSHWTGIVGYTNQTECQGPNNGYANTSSAKTSNIAGKIEFYPWRVESWGGAGLNSNYDMSGIWYDASNSPSGSAGVAGSCLNTQTSNAFSTMTGIVGMFEGNGHTASDRRWALYEIDY